MRRPAQPPSRATGPGRPGRLTRIVDRLRAGGRFDAGMTTAEYAVGTVAACGFGGLLYKILTSGTVMHLLENIISRALHLGF